jgi:hypothetical protein
MNVWFRFITSWGTGTEKKLWDKLKFVHFTAIHPCSQFRNIQKNRPRNLSNMWHVPFPTRILIVLRIHETQRESEEWIIIDFQNSWWLRRVYWPRKTQFYRYHPTLRGMINHSNNNLTDDHHPDHHASSATQAPERSRLPYIHGLNQDAYQRIGGKSSETGDIRAGQTWCTFHITCRFENARLYSICVFCSWIWVLMILFSCWPFNDGNSPNVNDTEKYSFDAWKAVSYHMKNPYLDFIGRAEWTDPFSSFSVWLLFEWRWSFQ